MRILELTDRHFANAILNRAEDAAKVVLPRAQALDATDTGVWFGCWRHSAPPIGFAFGHASPDSWVMYMHHSAEKGSRLLQTGDVSSFRTRSVIHDLSPWLHSYGGAIQVGGLVFTPSGLSEHFDELFAVLVAESLDVITRTDIRHIADISNNPHLRRHYNL